MKDAYREGHVGVRLNDFSESSQSPLTSRAESAHRGYGDFHLCTVLLDTAVHFRVSKFPQHLLGAKQGEA